MTSPDQFRPWALRSDVSVERRADGDYLIRDGFQIADKVATLPAWAMALVSWFDGQKTVSDLSQQFHREAGAEIDGEAIVQLAETLDAALLLDSPEFQERLSAQLARPVRRAACAGSAYPAAADALERFLSEQWTRPGGPLAGKPKGQSAVKTAALQSHLSCRALISPHIDIVRGGACYAWGWRHFAARSQARTFVIFGTSHQGLLGRYALTRKAFETPLGTIEVDTDLVDSLVNHYDGPDDLLANEQFHFGEHSIEFQVVHLAHYFRDQEIRIVPVLCGSLHDLFWSGLSPSEDRGVVSFLKALKGCLSHIGDDDLAFIAGVDWAHVGAQFDQPELSAAAHQDVRRADLARLECALGGDMDDFHSMLARDRNAHQVCGHAPIVALLGALEDEAVDGRLLNYDSWYDGQSMVGFASAVFSQNS